MGKDGPPCAPPLRATPGATSAGPQGTPEKATPPQRAGRGWGLETGTGVTERPGRQCNSAREKGGTELRAPQEVLKTPWAMISPTSPSPCPGPQSKTRQESKAAPEGPLLLERPHYLGTRPTL